MPDYVADNIDGFDIEHQIFDHVDLYKEHIVSTNIISYQETNCGEVLHAKLLC